MQRSYQEDSKAVWHPLAIETIWRSFAVCDGHHRVLPDGRCDIILRFPSDGLKPSGAIAVRIAGPSTRFHLVPISAGTAFVGVRLRPGMAGGVLALNPGSIVDRVLMDDEAMTALPALAELCRPAASIDALTERLGLFVAGRFRLSHVDPLTTSMIDMLHVTGGRMPIAELAKLHDMDVRTARRRITAATGLGPKQLAAIIRFHRALRLRHAGLGSANAAIEAGYADQAHMSRTFRQMGGIGSARLPELALAGLTS
ncbi:helix-turn-helix domain-containing protein [Methylobacterium gossipiicola]|uniref:Helix-turn-helix domain-containing protein n=1 Tax=Methylobacterium gossipiicola TaxID=582675 RepID=A0A1I2URE4_9HYPH|nr:helix-turn-helix domain-containing protein [Methylobacterium gossipiicola]SFG79570.1 Helix-turn-helix domain-containing protein [Methylobacterium gossipiicola]